MRRFVCDACGKMVNQCIYIKAEPRKADPRYVDGIEEWRAPEIEGEYCQKCTDSLSLFMAKLKGREDIYDIQRIIRERESEDDGT